LTTSQVPDDRPILVLDTNTVLRGFNYESGASGKLLRLCKRREAITLLSKPVLDEYREVLGAPELVGEEPETPAAVEDLIDALRFVGEYISEVHVRFEMPRDPDDAMFIELAIAGDATHIISHDKDLLTLPTSRTDAGKRFRQRLPGIKVQDAATFVRVYRHLFHETP
jgi:putative PIN family toxin of toxin-antitoxin system